MVMAGPTFNVLQWGDYSIDGLNAGGGAPFALPSSGIQLMSARMGPVATTPGVAGGTNFTAFRGNGWR